MASTTLQNTPNTTTTEPDADCKLAYGRFTEALAWDLFMAKSVLEAARVMLAKELNTDEGNGMHIDNVLIDVDNKMQALVDRLNASYREYEAVAP